MKNHSKVITITGGSGVVGRDLIDRLRLDHQIIAIARTELDIPGVKTVHGDVSKERFGLDEEAWRELAWVTDVVIHSAAVTTWGLPKESYYPVNVDGTRRIIELARAAGAPLHLISSCFVQALESPRSAELLGPTNVVHPYISSKREAERLVRESGVPYNIYRPTNLVGHSETGASSRPQIVQMMSDWLARNKAPYLPSHSGNLIDVAPIDMVSDAVAGTIESGDLGEELWISYGAESMTVEEAVEEIIKHAGSSLGRAVDRIPVVDPRGVLPVPIDEVPPMSRTFLKVLIDVSEVTCASGGTLPTSLPALRSKYRASEITCAQAFRQGLEYWAAQRRMEDA